MLSKKKKRAAGKNQCCWSPMDVRPPERFYFLKIRSGVAAMDGAQQPRTGVRPDRIFKKQNRGRRARTSIPEISFNKSMQKYPSKDHFNPLTTTH